MPKLPEKKVGIIACSGEEMAEGTISRLAALKVLQEMRPQETVTICLPLFLAGGEGDRAFAKFYPTIAVDGCAERCAARATEAFSGKPAVEVVVSDLVAANGLDQPQGLRRLNEAGLAAVGVTADFIAQEVDTVLDRKWSRRKGEFADAPGETTSEVYEEASCACGSGIPVLNMAVNGEQVSVIALPAIFAMVYGSGDRPSAETNARIMEQVRIYNSIADADAPQYADAVAQAYASYCRDEELAS